MDGNLSAVLVAVMAAIPATFAAIGAARVHKEVRTNHGIRNGARMEQLTDDVTWLKDNIVLSSEFVEHDKQDKVFQARVEPFLSFKEQA